MGADVRGVAADVLPEMALGDVEAVLFRVGRQRGVAIPREPVLILLLPHVREALEEQQAENVVLVVPRIDRPAQDVRRPPEVGFQLRQRQRHSLCPFVPKPPRAFGLSRHRRACIVCRFMARDEA